MTHVKDYAEFLAGDHTRLRELFRPTPATAAIRYSLAHARLEPGRASKRHRLATSEVYYFLSGHGRFRIGHETADVESGSVVYVPPGSVQSLENIGRESLEFLCLVDPAWRREDEEILK